MKYSVTVVLSHSFFTYDPASANLPCLSFEIIQFAPHVHFSFWFFFIFCQQRPASRSVVSSFCRRQSSDTYLPLGSAQAQSLPKLPACRVWGAPWGKICVVSPWPAAPSKHKYGRCHPDTSSYVLWLTKRRPLAESSGVTHLEMAGARQGCHKTARAASQPLWSLAIEVVSSTPRRVSDDLSRSG